MRYWFVEVEVRSGEMEHIIKSIHTTKNNEEFDLNAYAQDFYGDGGEELEEGVYEFDCGCIIVSAYRCDKITKKEYEVLRKFL